MAEFSGKNVLLKSLKPHDLEQVLNWGQDSAESFFLLNFPPLFNRDDLARELSKKGTEMFMISLKKDQCSLGLIKMGPLRLPERQTQLRFTIDTYENYTAALPLEAATLVLDHYFHKLNIHKVHAYTLEFEKEYEALLKKLGFNKEGAYQRQFFHKEKLYAVNIFGLFKKDFLR